MSSAADCNVAVVGGGPAGSAAALVLAQHGRDVMLLERNSGDSPKLCGEFLSARGVRQLERIGAIHAVLNAGAIEVPGWSVASARHEFRRRFARPGLAVSRTALDPALRRLASERGVVVREGVRVVSVEWTERGAHLAVAREASEIVSAQQMIVSCGRAARIPGVTEVAAHSDFVAMKAHVRDLSPEPIARVALYALGDAYVGVVPTASGALNICFLARRAAFRRAGSAEAFLDDAARGSAPWRERWQSIDAGASKWIAVSALPSANGQPVRHRAFVAGDAAAHVAPLLGAGMALALESGALAGEATELALGSAPEAWVRAEYSRVWRGVSGRPIALGRLLQSVLLRPRASDLGVRFLEFAPQFGDWLSGTST